MKELNDGYFSLTKYEVAKSLGYHGEATFYVNGKLATYNNPNEPKLMDNITNEMSLWQFDNGQRTIVFNTVDEALKFVMSNGKTIGDAIETFKFEDFV